MGVTMYESRRPWNLRDLRGLEMSRQSQSGTLRSAVKGRVSSTEGACTAADISGLCAGCFQTPMREVMTAVERGFGKTGPIQADLYAGQIDAVWSLLAFDPNELQYVALVGAGNPLW